MKIDESKLKNLLKEKGITKSNLCKTAGISSRTIAKIAKNEDIGNIVINKLCNYLQCNLNDIICANNVLNTLKKEKQLNISGGLYYETQVRLTYNSNHMEGSKLTEAQTRYIFETNTIGFNSEDINIDDVLETTNHFKCIDYVIDFANQTLDESFIKKLHYILKLGTSDEKRFGYIGDYKKLQNTVGGIETANVKDVGNKIKTLLLNYNLKTKIGFEDIVEFHYEFEKIHPFQDGNGRIGRLIAFKECLKNNIVPFYIDDKYKFPYYNGLQQWAEDKNYLIETCLFGQDLYKRLLDYFEISY